jgi:hypothetical protein
LISNKVDGHGWFMKDPGASMSYFPFLGSLVKFG